MPKTAFVGWPGRAGHQRDGVEDLVDQRVGVEDVERRSVGHGEDAYRGRDGGDVEGCDPLRRNRRPTGVSKGAAGPGGRLRGLD